MSVFRSCIYVELCICTFPSVHARSNKLEEDNSKKTCKESHPSTLVPAFNSTRLRPIRQKTRNAVLSVLEDGSVCIEFLKSRSPCSTVSEVVRISGDGLQVIAYRPKKGDGPVPVHPSSPPPLPEHYSSYLYESLPRKYWRKYEYAARFISLLKQKTPKVTYFSRQAKCMLMESAEHFEAVFYQGPKFTVQADTVKVIDSSGLNITMETESDSKLLSAEVQEMWQHVKTCKQHCLKLEELLRTAEDSSTHFPAVVGNRTLVRANEHAPPTKLDSPSAPSVSASNLGSFCGSTMSRLNSASTQLSSAHGGIIPHQPYEKLTGRQRELAIGSVSGLGEQNVFAPEVCSSTASQQRRYVRELGWITQTKDGSLHCQLNDGTELVVHSHHSYVQFVDKSGVCRRFGEGEGLPDVVKQRLQLVSEVISSL